MFQLVTTTEKVQVVLSANVTTTQLECLAQYRDRISGSAPLRTIINTNNTTAVDVVPSPADTVTRFVEWLTVTNRDTASATVTLRFNNNGTLIILQKIVLGPDEVLEYTARNGYRILENNGAAKVAMSAGSNSVASGLQSVTTTADVTNNNAVANTIADVTGLSFPVVAGQRYWFVFTIPYTAAATTTGSRWSISGPASPTELRYKSEYSLTATTITINEGLSAYDTPAASNATSAATGSNLAVIEGFIMPSANGNVIARFASEVLSSAIVAKRGALVRYIAVG